MLCNVQILLREQEAFPFAFSSSSFPFIYSVLVNNKLKQ